MAQSVKHPTPDFGSGHDLTVYEFEPQVGLCADTEPAWDSLSLSLSLCPLPSLSPSLIHALSLKIKKDVYLFIFERDRA